MDRKPLRILIVEDSDDLRDALGKSLESLGHKVKEAGSGEAALEVALTNSFDLVISDVDMSDGTGPWLIQKLTEASNMVPVILMSGRVGAENIATSNGAKAFLAKPFKMSDLEDIIARL